MSPRIDERRERHRHAAWHGSTSLDHGLFILGYRLTPEALPGWELLRAQVFALPGAPRGTQSVWRSAGEGSLASLDVYECGSRAEAHDFLSELLDEFESPRIELRDDLVPGDVTFMGREHQSIAFARGNLVLSLASAGPRPFDVVATAVAFDERLCVPWTEPPDPGPPVVLAGRPGEPVAIELGLSLEDAVVTVWVRGDRGSLAGGAGAVRYTPEAGDPVDIRVLIQRPGQPLAARAVRVELTGG